MCQSWGDSLQRPSLPFLLLDLAGKGENTFRAELAAEGPGPGGLSKAGVSLQVTVFAGPPAARASAGEPPACRAPGAPSPALPPEGGHGRLQSEAFSSVLSLPYSSISRRACLPTRRPLPGAAQGETSHGTCVAGPALRADPVPPTELGALGSEQAPERRRGSWPVECSLQRAPCPPGEQLSCGGSAREVQAPGGLGAAQALPPLSLAGWGLLVTLRGQVVPAWVGQAHTAPESASVGDPSSQRFPSVSSRPFM